MYFKDRIGERFGRLTVIERAESYINPNGTPRTAWKCKCDCGNEVVVLAQSLSNGATKSCGCLKKERVHEICRTHGELVYKKKRTRLYCIWENMKRRCFNPKNQFYYCYGGRGITVCDEWKDSFEAFREWAYSSGYDEYLTIDRVNVDGNYEPDNCRWVTMKEQSNNKRTSHFLTFNGETKTIAQWSEATGFSYPTLFMRIKRGLSAEETLLTPREVYKDGQKMYVASKLLPLQLLQN